VQYKETATESFQQTSYSDFPATSLIEMIFSVILKRKGYLLCLNDG